MVHKFTAHTTRAPSPCVPSPDMGIYRTIGKIFSHLKEEKVDTGEACDTYLISFLQRFVVSILSRKYNYNAHVASQHHTASYSIIQHHTASRSITQHHAASRSITQHHAASRSITQHHTASHSIIQHHTASRSHSAPLSIAQHRPASPSITPPNMHQTISL